MTGSICDVTDVTYQFSFQREQERLKKTVEKKNSQIAERTQSRQEKVQDAELVASLTQRCKEREDKVAELERELKCLAVNLAETTSRQHIRSADKATTTDELGNNRISSPLLDGQLQESDAAVTTSDELAPARRRRRAVGSSSGKRSSATALPPTPPRSGSGGRKTSGLSRYLELRIQPAL